MRKRGPWHAFTIFILDIRQKTREESLKDSFYPNSAIGRDDCLVKRKGFGVIRVHILAPQLKGNVILDKWLNFFELQLRQR